MYTKGSRSLIRGTVQTSYSEWKRTAVVRDYHASPRLAKLIDDRACPFPCPSLPMLALLCVLPFCFNHCAKLRLTKEENLLKHPHCPRLLLARRTVRGGWWGWTAWIPLATPRPEQRPGPERGGEARRGQMDHQRGRSGIGRDGWQWRAGEEMGMASGMDATS